MGQNISCVPPLPSSHRSLRCRRTTHNIFHFVCRKIHRSVHKFATFHNSKITLWLAPSLSLRQMVEGLWDWRWWVSTLFFSPPPSHHIRRYYSCSSQFILSHFFRLLFLVPEHHHRRWYYFFFLPPSARRSSRHIRQQSEGRCEWTQARR